MAQSEVRRILEEAVEWAKAKILKNWGQFQVQISDDLRKFSGVYVNQMCNNKIDRFNLVVCGVY